MLGFWIWKSEHQIDALHALGLVLCRKKQNLRVFFFRSQEGYLKRLFVPIRMHFCVVNSNVK